MIEEKKINCFLILLIKSIVILGTLTSFASIFLQSIGYDEAWIVISGRSLVEDVSGIMDHYTPVLGTGAPYIFSVAFLHMLFGPNIWVIRSISFLALLLIYFVSAKLLKRFVNIKHIFWISACLIIGVHGTITLSATAYAILPASLFFLLGFYVFCDLSIPTIKRALLTGLLWGVAASIRANIVLVLPALILWWFFDREKRKSNWKEVLIICVLTYFLKYILSEIQIYAYDYDLSILKEAELRAIGFSGLSFKSWMLFNRLGLINGWLSFGLIALSLYVPKVFMSSNDKEKRFAFLVYFFILTFLAWLFIAPIPHLRYFWVGLLSSTLLLAIGILQIYKKMEARANHAIKSLLLIFVLGFGAFGFFQGVRSALLGDVNITAWELERGNPDSIFKPFKYIRGQRALIDYLNKQDSNIDFYSIGGSVEISYLTGLTIPTLGNEKTPLTEKKAYLIITPMVGNHLSLTADIVNWVEDHCTLLKQFGAYTVYEINGSQDLKNPMLSKFISKNSFKHPLTKRYSSLNADW